MHTLSDFVEADANGDGVVTMAEFDAFRRNGATPPRTRSSRSPDTGMPWCWRYNPSTSFARMFFCTSLEPPMMVMARFSK